MTPMGWRRWKARVRFGAAGLTLWAFLPAPGRAETPSTRTASFHGGFFHPSGVDVAGYTVEHRWERGLHAYYTFGIPSFAAAGLSFYQNHEKHGLVATAGLGIGSIGYASLAYQWKFREGTFIKAGAGYATGIAYSGLFPVASIEWRK